MSGSFRVRSRSNFKHQLTKLAGTIKVPRVKEELPEEPAPLQITVARGGKFSEYARPLVKHIVQEITLVGIS